LIPRCLCFWRSLWFFPPLPTPLQCPGVVQSVTQRQRLWPAVCVPGSLRTKSLEAVSSRVNALHLIYVYITHTHTYVYAQTHTGGGVKETYMCWTIMYHQLLFKHSWLCVHRCLCCCVLFSFLCLVLRRVLEGGHRDGEQKWATKKNYFDI